MLLAHTSMESIPQVEAHEVAPSPRKRGEVKQALQCQRNAL
jgi:hypothetical protein